MKRSIWLRLPMVIAAGSLLLNVASASASPGTNVRLTHDETAGAYVSAYTLGTGTALPGSTLQGWHRAGSGTAPCTTPPGWHRRWGSLPQGALRDPGLCCATASR